MLRRRRRIAFAGAVVLCTIAACGASVRARQTPPPGGPVQMSAETITEISLERRCFGCERQFKLTFARDGTATRTTFGSARQGIPDRTSAGTVSVAAFDELAGRVVAEGFARLLDEYADPQTADGASAVTTVTAAGRLKSVVDRHDKAPDALRRLQARIEELATSVVWKPEP